MPQTMVTLRDTQWTWLVGESQRTGATKAEIVRRALDAYMDQDAEVPMPTPRQLSPAIQALSLDHDEPLAGNEIPQSVVHSVGSEIRPGPLTTEFVCVSCDRGEHDKCVDSGGLVECHCRERHHKA